MAQDVTTLTGEDYLEGKSPCCSDTGALSEGDKEYDDILELNQFDGLPYSSRFYKLLKERKELPVWKAKCEFMDTLAKEQFVVVSGSAKTGRSSQVSTVGYSTFQHWMVFGGFFTARHLSHFSINLKSGSICNVSNLSC